MKLTEEQLERNRQYKLENRGRIKRQKRQYYLQNRERLLEQNRLYKEKNKERITEQNRLYRETRRQANIPNIREKLAPEKHMCEKHMCRYCGKPNIRLESSYCSPECYRKDFSNAYHKRRR